MKLSKESKLYAFSENLANVAIDRSSRTKIEPIGHRLHRRQEHSTHGSTERNATDDRASQGVATLNGRRLEGQKEAYAVRPQQEASNGCGWTNEIDKRRKDDGKSHRYERLEAMRRM